MNAKIKGLFLLVCTCLVVMLGLSFLSKSDPIEVQMPLVTVDMVKENQAKIQKAKEKKEDAAAARQRAELEAKLYQCAQNDECIIVDKDPCGCLKGPEGVTAINSSMALEFSRLMQQEAGGSTVCPQVASTERECSPSARAVCQQNRCQIVY